MVYVPGFGWLESQGPNHVEYAEDMYENGNKISIIGINSKTAPHKQGNTHWSILAKICRELVEQKPQSSLQCFCYFSPKEIPFYLCVVAIAVAIPLIVRIAAPAMGDHVKATRRMPTVSHAHDFQWLSALGARVVTSLCRGGTFLQPCFKCRNQITP